MNIWDFFTPEAGQKRRRWLEGQAGGLLEYVPPELRPWLAIAEEMNPVTSMERAGSASKRMVAPGMSGWDRMAAAGDMLSNVAGVVAPAVAARAAGVPVANAVEEVLTGYSPMVQPFLADEAGALKLTPRGDYVGQHTAPSLASGASLDNPADIWGDDIYRREAVQWFGTGDPSLDRQSVSVIQRARNNPDADVVIYRAVPADAPDDINAGDWVTTSERYAREHGESWLDGKYRIVRETVKAGELATDGNSIHEWGWWPSEKRLRGLLNQ